MSLAGAGVLAGGAATAVAMDSGAPRGGGLQDGSPLVLARDFEWTPDRLTVVAGTTVRFRNVYGSHNLRFVGEEIGTATANEPWETARSFPAAGEFVYYCEPHGSPDGGMRGRIIVTAAASPSPGATTPGPPATAPAATGGPPPVTAPLPAPSSAVAGVADEPPRLSRLSVRADRAGRVVIAFRASEAVTVTVRLRRVPSGPVRRISRRVGAGPARLVVARHLLRGRYAVNLRIRDRGGNVTTRRATFRLRR